MLTKKQKIENSLLDNSIETLSDCRKLEHLLKMLQQRAEADHNDIYSDVLAIAVAEIERIHDRIDSEITTPICRASLNNKIGA